MDPENFGYLGCDYMDYVNYLEPWSDGGSSASQYLGCEWFPTSSHSCLTAAAETLRLEGDETLIGPDGAVYDVFYPSKSGDEKAQGQIYYILYIYISTYYDIHKPMVSFEKSHLLFRLRCPTSELLTQLHGHAFGNLVSAQPDFCTGLGGFSFPCIVQEETSTTCSDCAGGGLDDRVNGAYQRNVKYWYMIF